jgi:hypothetical protein
MVKIPPEFACLRPDGIWLAVQVSVREKPEEDDEDDDEEEEDDQDDQDEGNSDGYSE